MSISPGYTGSKNKLLNTRSPMNSNGDMIWLFSESWAYIYKEIIIFFTYYSFVTANCVIMNFKSRLNTFRYPFIHNIFLK